MLFIHLRHPYKGFRGRVARLGSAKAPTAVRIRSEPQEREVFKNASLFLFP